ncbi:MAG: hypothetical protein WDM76_12395 [Limisphaerales bacterium]
MVGTNEMALPLASNELFIVASTKQIEISPEPRSKTDVGDLIAAVKARNIERGFYQQEQKRDTAKDCRLVDAKRLGANQEVSRGTFWRD